MDLSWIKLLPWMPAVAAVLCAVCCAYRPLRGFAAVICVAGIAIPLGMTVAVSDHFTPWKPKAEKSHASIVTVDAPVDAAAAHDPAAHASTNAQPDDHGNAAHGEDKAHGGGHARPKAESAAVVAFEWLTLGSSQHVFDTQAEATKYIDEHPHRPNLELTQDGASGQWIVTGAAFVANFSYFIDPLTIIMLLVVTGVGTLVAIYASGYMKGDPGYARFFVGVSLFIFAMTTLVLADNLVLLYLGWEGVGLCSYLLIGYYYKKPSAVAAGKKAFIVNRIGDLGFALGIFFIYQRYGTVIIPEIIEMASSGALTADWRDQLIPFLLMLGAFGKSAQLPLYVWLPDAMEGPTPVSALIHAATMVTAGVYMIARLTAVFELSAYALPTVAAIGAATALFAATIALKQYDIKRIYAYSTISQLGYMFLGVGVGFEYAVYGAVFHLFTHAFFKALLFLTSGSVMHALAGQLDLRNMSGLRHKMPVTCWLMFIGCLALVAFPFTSGFFSKDAILAGAFERGIDRGEWWFNVLGAVGLVAAMLTSYYTFRLWFRVFMGPEHYVMGDEHHEDDHGHGDDDHSHAHAHEPHEMPWLMNGPLVVLAVGALLAGFIGYEWFKPRVLASTAGIGVASPQGHMDTLHLVLQIASGVIAVGGIAVAAYFHWLRRPAADALQKPLEPIAKVLENKYYVDEFNDAAIVRPLRWLGGFFQSVDRLVVEGLVRVTAFVPRVFGLTAQSGMQRGMLQGYGLTMVAGAAILVLVALAVMQ